MHHTPNALFVGRTCFDVIQVVEEPPGNNKKVRSNRHVMAAGGPATNAAVAFAALGGQATIASVLGDDFLGRAALDDIQASVGDALRHVHLTDAVVDTLPSTIAINKDTGDRTVVSVNRPAKQRSMRYSSAMRELIDGPFAFDAVLCDPEEADVARGILEFAQSRGIPTIADVGIHKPKVDQLYPHLDSAVVAEDFFADTAPERIVAILREIGIPYGAVTCGERPLHWWTPQGEGTVQPPHVETVVDTLGAGDFFHGAYTHAIATTGLSPEHHVAALESASKVSALSVSHFGPREWIKHL